MLTSAQRLEKLLVMLQTQPRDPFLFYAAALEYKKAGNNAAALEYLSRAIEADPQYHVAYQQRGQLHRQGGNIEAARADYREGIRRAMACGQKHAVKEMELALSSLG